MSKKKENRNIDTAKARGELEEDLLEYVYRKWRQGRQITSKEYARTTGITGYEAAGLVRSLVTKGFLYEPERRNPRFLATGYEKLEHSAILRIKKSENCFLLRTKKRNHWGLCGIEERKSGYRTKKKKMFISSRQIFLPTLPIRVSQSQKQWQSLLLPVSTKNHCRSIIGN